MGSSIRIRMMGAFSVSTGGQTAGWLPEKTPKGVGLVELLILHRGEILSRRRLFRELWGGDAGAEYNGALKTLVSRTRRHLDAAAEDLGGCIVTARNGYLWASGPEVTADALDILDLCAESKWTVEPRRRLALARQLVDCYPADLYLNGVIDSGASLSAWLHREYLNTVSQCLSALRTAGDHAAICELTAAAIRVDPLDEGVSLARIRALLALNRVPEARMEYLRVTQAHRRELGSQPSPDLVRFQLAIAEAERRAPDAPEST